MYRHRSHAGFSVQRCSHILLKIRPLPSFSSLPVPNVIPAQNPTKIARHINMLKLCASIAVSRLFDVQAKSLVSILKTDSFKLFLKTFLCVAF